MLFVDIHPHGDPAQKLCQFFRQLRHSEHDPVDLRKREQRHLHKLGKKPDCIICLLPKFDLFPVQTPLEKSGHGKSLFDRRQTFRFFSIRPGIPEFPDDQRDLVIVRIDFQRLRFQLLFIIKADLACLLVDLISYYIALSHRSQPPFSPCYCSNICAAIISSCAYAFIRVSFSISEESKISFSRP
ncbi:unknown [Lachnospiraceae bacterium CAG:215]|nr:unknown [Lachnospiraceae bacterium CAG:215]